MRWEGLGVWCRLGIRFLGGGIRAKFVAVQRVVDVISFLFGLSGQKKNRDRVSY